MLTQSYQGRKRYLDALPDSIEEQNRIVLTVEFGFRIHTAAVVDTASPFCILNPKEAGLLDLGDKSECPLSRLNIRGIVVLGRVCRIPITIRADEGEDLTIDASVLIPDLEVGQRWRFPNFLGLSGFLDRIRFAVDPQENWFYFGAWDA